MALHNRSQLPRKHSYTEHGDQEVQVLLQVKQAFYLYVYILYILSIHLSHFDVLLLPNILYVISLTLPLCHYGEHIHENYT